ncbi:aminoglycoside phosphotransferase family protein [Brasilonema sp. CT11]|nr:aminoglycoside phosphotransferase family protein [Brasilonema sp. CT11]
MTYSKDAHEWLSQSIGIPHCHFDVVQMKGSTSCSVFLIHCSRDFNPQKFVLRVLDNQEWLAEESDLAHHEAAALEEAQKTGLQVPKLVAYSTNDVGFGAPVVLMSYLEGNVELCPANFQQWLNDLAKQLALLHQHTANSFPWRFHSWVEKATLAPPKWTTIPHVWERAIELLLGSEPAEQPVFIHRDYHPANVLSHGGRVSGIVDWINACQGPAGVDVAICRTDLALMFGFAAADQFLDAYTAISVKFDYHPYWDIDSILEMSLPQPTFYKPWQDFGLSVIAPELLRDRIDAYLESVIRRI